MPPLDISSLFLLCSVLRQPDGTDCFCKGKAMKMQIYLYNLKSHKAVCVQHYNEQQETIESMFPSRLVVTI